MARKEIKIGRVRGEEYGYKRPLLVTLEITLKQLEGLYRDTELYLVKDPYALRIVGNIWNPAKTDVVVGGQINDEIEQALKNNQFAVLYIPKYRLERLLKIWKDYHLNDTMPGTERQMKIVKGIPYFEAVTILESHNLLVDRGYEYGTEWLVRRIPDDVIEFIKEIVEK